MPYGDDVTQQIEEDFAEAQAWVPDQARIDYPNINSNTQGIITKYFDSPEGMPGSDIRYQSEDPEALDIQQGIQSGNPIEKVGDSSSSLQEGYQHHMAETPVGKTVSEVEHGYGLPESSVENVDFLNTSTLNEDADCVVTDAAPSPDDPSSGGAWEVITELDGYTIDEVTPLTTEGAYDTITVAEPFDSFDSEF